MVFRNFDVSCAASVSVFWSPTPENRRVLASRKITVFRMITRIFTAMFRPGADSQQQVLHRNGLMEKIIATINKNEKS